jgi:GntR family transcriptional regulator, transcriptional repressor for pyruvate dehydrogenase complex
VVLRPVERKSLSDDVFEQLSAEILRGKLSPGALLPSERDLCRVFGVNRGAVREAMKRLGQAGFVESRHGSGNRVRDVLRTAGLDALPRLLIGRNGETDPRVLRGVLEMRLTVGADAARLAAERAPESVAAALEALVDTMRDCADDVPRLQRLSMAAWELVVDGSGNLPYRLAFNSMMAVYEQVLPLWENLLSPELKDQRSWRALVRAIRARDARAAQSAGQRILEQGNQAAFEALALLEAASTATPSPEEEAR